MIAHVLSVAHGLAAALASSAVFYLAGLLLLPRSWAVVLRWPDLITLGLTFYVLLCWAATGSRSIPLSYVMLVFGGVLWGLTSLRFRRLQDAAAGAPPGGIRRWVIEFGILYVLAYALVLPAAGRSLLTLAPEGSRDLVTYARYADHLLASGTANVDLATFEFARSPASVYLLAWHALLFTGDPLDAAMPALFMLSALFAMIAAESSRTAFGLSRRASLAIAAIAVCAPMFRWTLAIYAFGELLAAMSIMYLAYAVGTAVARQARPGAPLAVGLAAGCVLMYFSGRGAILSPVALTAGIGDVIGIMSPLALFGLPGRTPSAEQATDGLRSAARPGTNRIRRRRRDPRQRRRTRRSRVCAASSARGVA
jgi:hypothetical protein